MAALTGGEHWPSHTLDHQVTADDSPPVRMAVTDATTNAQDLQWGYVLHQQGIEVISLLHEDIGPAVDWDIDPRTAFNDHPAAWPSSRPAFFIHPPRGGKPAPNAPASMPATSHPKRPAPRR